MKNELLTLDGLIARLTELRDYIGKDCRVVVGPNFDSRKNCGCITVASLDQTSKDEYVSLTVERGDLTDLDRQLYYDAENVVIAYNTLSMGSVNEAINKLALTLKKNSQ